MVGEVTCAGHVRGSRAKVTCTGHVPSRSRDDLQLVLDDVGDGAVALGLAEGVGAEKLLLHDDEDVILKIVNYCQNDIRRMVNLLEFIFYS